jgi:hypothetical protein
MGKVFKANRLLVFAALRLGGVDGVGGMVVDRQIAVG